MAIIRNVQELRDYFGLNPVLIADLSIDVLRSETPIYDFEVTEHPVESGFEIADARIARPIGVTLEIILTDTELSASAVGFAALENSLGYDTWRDKRDRLYEIKDSNELIDVVTPLGTYESVTISSIRIDQTPSTSQALFCRVDFREVRIVSTEINNVNDDEVSKLKRAKKNDSKKKINSKKDKGTKQTQDSTPKQQSLLKSWVG